MRSSKTREILRYLALGGGAIVISLLAPQLPAKILQAYLRGKLFQKKELKRDLRRLQARELLTYKENSDGTIHVKIREEGKLYILQSKFDALVISKPTTWDKKWRMVMFDIPTSRNRARDVLRRKICELGFYQLQRSVFIFPYACKKEILFVASLVHVENDIIIFEVGRFVGEEKLKRYFHLA